jgi:nucleotide-binding universal stress UspA family protein
MKPSVSRILLPITSDPYFPQAADMALQLAQDFGAEITLVAIDDNSRPYETVSLPFHDGDFVASVLKEEEIATRSVPGGVEEFLARATEQKVKANEIYVQGHSATQMLLVSRFYDLIVTSAEPWFTDVDQLANQRVNPLIEILDQTVVPIFMAGTRGETKVNSAAVLFDGGPCATMALHALAALLIHSPATSLHVRVSMIEETMAQFLAEDCVRFLRSKGYENVVTEYSPLAPMEAIASGNFSPVDLTALGIRSRNTFHDLHVGVLAKHLIENPHPGHTLLC